MPTGLDVLKLYCSEWDSTQVQSEKITSIVDSIKRIWSLADIPVRETASIRLKVKNLLDKFKSILNTRRKSTVSQVGKEDAFIEKNRSLFDIVNQKAELKLSHDQKAFLDDQRNDRLRNIPDLNSCENDLIDVNMSDNDDSMSASKECSRDDNNGDGTSEDDIDYYPSSSDSEESPPKKKLKQATILKLDNAGLSFRQMQQVSQAFIEEFGGKSSDYCLGVSTFHAQSTKIRRVTATEMSDKMKHRRSKLVLLFDTKTCNQINAAHLPREKRLAIVAYNERTHYGIGSSTEKYDESSHENFFHLLDLFILSF